MPLGVAAYGWLTWMPSRSTKRSRPLLSRPPGDLSVPVEDLNPNGGAIALGHPIGMSGTRLPFTLALELRRRGGGTGAAALCGGGGLGDDVILRTVP